MVLKLVRLMQEKTKEEHQQEIEQHLQEITILAGEEIASRAQEEYSREPHHVYLKCL